MALAAALGGKRIFAKDRGIGRAAGAQARTPPEWRSIRLPRIPVAGPGLWIVAPTLLLVLLFGSVRPTAAQGGPESSPPTAGLVAGVGSADLTPEPGSPMSGYGDRDNEPSTGVHDRLKARALFLRMGETKVCLVSCDMLVITPELRKAVLQRTAAAGIDRVLLAATHTHSGPGGYKDGWLIGKMIFGDYSEEMFTFLADRIAEAVLAAARSPVPATVGFASGAAPDLVRNRRHTGGPTDPEVTVLRIDGPGGAPLALVIGFAAHPTVLSPSNLEYSGDYAGMATRKIEEATRAASLFFIGANGDQEPHFPGYGAWEESRERQLEQADRIAGALSEEVLRVARGIEPVPVRVLQAATREIELPSVDLRDSCFYYVFSPLLRLLFHDLFHDTAVFQAIRIDDLVIAGIPAEVSSAIGRRLKDDLGRGRTMLVGLADGWTGYVLESGDYESGGYEACMSYYGPDFGEFLEGEVGAVATASKIGPAGAPADGSLRLP